MKKRKRHEELQDYLYSKLSHYFKNTPDFYHGEVPITVNGSVPFLKVLREEPEEETRRNFQRERAEKRCRKLICFQGEEMPICLVAIYDPVKKVATIYDDRKRGTAYTIMANKLEKTLHEVLPAVRLKRSAEVPTNLKIWF